MTHAWLQRALIGGAVALLALTLYPSLGLAPLFLAAWILWWPVRDAPEGRAILAVLLLFLFLWILHQVRWVVYPLLAGMLLAYLLDPLVDRMERIRVPRSIGAVLALLPLGVLAALVASVLLPTLAGQFQEILEKLPGLYRNIQDWADPLLSRLDLLPSPEEQKPPWLLQLLSHLESILKAALTGMTEVSKGVTRAVQWIGMIFLTPVLAYYLLVDWDRIRDGAKELVPPRWRATAERVGGDVQEVLPRYVRGQVLVAGIQTVLYIVGFLLAGLAEPVALGFLAGIFSLIPVLGFWATVFVVGLSAAISPDPVSTLVKVALVFAVMQALESQVLVPRVQGSGLGLHPLAVLLAVLGFGLLFGLPGVVIAVPMLGILRASLPRLRAAYRESRFYAGSARSGD